MPKAAIAGVQAEVLPDAVASYMRLFTYVFIIYIYIYIYVNVHVYISY